MTKDLETWTPNTDRSTMEHTKGVGFMLEDPKGHQYAYAMKFLFHVSNNEAEYEALLEALPKAKSLKLMHLIVRSDSQVVIA